MYAHRKNEVCPVDSCAVKHYHTVRSKTPMNPNGTNKRGTV